MPPSSDPGLAFLAALIVWLLVCLAFWAGVVAAGRPLPRQTGRHRRGDWYYERDEESETPSPLPEGVSGFAPTGPRGHATWSDRPTEPMPLVAVRR